MAISAVASELPRSLSADDFIPFDAKQAALGQLLFYDKILSGNRNISCGTCHHHDHGGADGLSLGIGEGGVGVGPRRVNGVGDDAITKRIPRNAPAFWNLGAKEIRVLFHDGRLSKSDLYDNGFNSPAEEWLPKGLTNLLSAQALLPLTAQFEMAGNPKENEIAGAVHDRIDKAWPIIAKRIRTIPEYAEGFIEAFENIQNPAEVTIVEIAEALAAFIGTEWQSIDAPFDAYIAGNKTALSLEQERGLMLFYGKAQCSTCHSGALLTDQKFHAIALPPFGPGRTRLFDPYARDVGHMGESDDVDDAYRFRTPSLRNVELTAPYGHNGAYPNLEGIVRHHMEPQKSFDLWKRDWANLPSIEPLKKADFMIMNDQREMARVRAKVDIDIPVLDETEIGDLVSFLQALTGENARSNTLPLGRPSKVPSGFSVD